MNRSRCCSATYLAQATNLLVAATALVWFLWHVIPHGILIAWWIANRLVIGLRFD